MKVFVAGASGALGTQLVPQLVASGHEVVGMTRTASKRDALRALGARPVVADALDPDAVARAVAEAEPEVIVHQLTALSGAPDMRHVDRFFAVTNRLRTEGTDHLLAAGRAVGARRFVAQSFAGWPFARVGGPVKSETDPLDPNPPEALGSTLAAIRYLEQAVAGIEWARHTVGTEGTGPMTGVRCFSAWKSLIASPPRTITSARSTRIWPRSYTGSNPRRAIAADNRPVNPVRSASNRNGRAPACATSRSSSPQSSNPRAHPVPCTEEVHPPQPVVDPRQIAFWLVGCTSSNLDLSRS